MAFNISPQINIYERDFTLTLEMKGDTKGAQSGVSSWGPAFSPVLITSGEEGLRSKFWTPTDQNYLSYFIARDFLKYSNKLVFNRVCGPLARNASAAAGIQCPGDHSYPCQNWIPTLIGSVAFEASVNNGPWFIVSGEFSTGGYLGSLLDQISLPGNGGPGQELFVGGGGGMGAFQMMGSNNATIVGSSGAPESQMFQPNPISVKLRDGIDSAVSVIQAAFGVPTIELQSCGFENWPGY